MLDWKLHGTDFQSNPPPRENTDVAIIHTIKLVYSVLYQTGNKLTKRDKLGIHAEAESVALLTFRDIISASLSSKIQKRAVLERARISLEVLKHLVRTEHELKIIDQKAYFKIESLLIETSKQANGWLKYITQNPTT